MAKGHSFHIPVMGVGFTIDSPLKLAHLGIDSVVSMLDDILVEKLRKMYCEKLELPYKEISAKVDDFRAKRFTAYLNFLQDQAEKKFEELKNAAVEKGQEFRDYLDLLPDSSEIKTEFKDLASKYINLNDIGKRIKGSLQMGSIDVNIMTKVDKDNYRRGEKLPIEYNDAHAALRGFAESNLKSSIILSAGMNPRLYNYIEQFEDFFPDNDGNIKKKIVLKVSDYRSALIQGKYFAKKGIWVSEYRIESGLNCGGHAFATDGFLLGPVLAEFKEKREELTKSVYDSLIQGCEHKNRALPKAELSFRITAQGGVGTSEEHEFLLDYYEVDSVGWGSPFLLVPEATTVDEATAKKLVQAKEADIYLSNISPLGVPFYSLRSNTKDVEKLERIESGKPGSPCPKRYVALNNDYNKQGLCTASAKFQKIKIDELGEMELDPKDYLSRYDKIVEKSCTCVGLGTTALIAHGISTKTEGPGVSACPGPNLAYFSRMMSMKEMVDHIYGRINVISRNDRPNMFVKELGIYINYLKDKIDETSTNMTKKQEKYLINFSNNLDEGIKYYQQLFSDIKGRFEDSKSTILQELDANLAALQLLKMKLQNQELSPVRV
ncbi:MAG: hypothetical protein DRI84_07625 [Bacteroidetes bacterium]|nr:MAG: hypothetical protein DRI84_07625 [Bacteroidota bacterium]